jgi:protein-tyrosine kinase
MSRIHEAMQKAALEAPAAPVADVAAFPFEPEPPSQREVKSVPASALSSFAQVTASAPAFAVPLQFDDLQKRCARPEWRPDPNLLVFANPAVSSVGAEQFRTLRSRLYQLRSNQPLRKILVTSAVSGEGKTFVATNLAQAIVRQRDRRVLIIDADLRSARLHLALGASSEPGLSDYLRGDIDEVTAIQAEQEGNLYLIPSGTKMGNPSELLSNGRLKQLLDRVGSFFDWVIIDSPPCLPVADSSVIADVCDGLLLVVKAGSTPAELAQRARHELEGRNVLGVVLNAVDEKALTYGSFYNTKYETEDSVEAAANRTVN